MKNSIRCFFSPALLPVGRRRYCFSLHSMQQQNIAGTLFSYATNEGWSVNPHFFRRYLEDDEGIKKYFAAFHLYKTFPVAVIIDGFGDFFNDRHCQERYGNARGRDLAMVRTLALCKDAITHANEKLQHKRPCKLLLSDTHHGDSPRLLFIYKRWISSIFTIKGDGLSSFLLKSMSSHSGRKITAKYSVALQYLVLEELIEDS